MRTRSASRGQIAALLAFLTGTTAAGLAAENWDRVAPQLPPDLRLGIERVMGVNAVPSASAGIATPKAPEAGITDAVASVTLPATEYPPTLPNLEPLVAPAPSATGSAEASPPTTTPVAGAVNAAAQVAATALEPTAAPTASPAIADAVTPQEATAASSGQQVAQEVVASPAEIDGVALQPAQADAPTTHQMDGPVDSEPAPDDLLSAARATASAELATSSDWSSSAQSKLLAATIPRLDPAKSAAAGPRVLVGTARPGSRVTVMAAGTALGEAEADPAGDWRLQLPNALPAGPTNLEIVERLGGASPVTVRSMIEFVVPPDAPETASAGAVSASGEQQVAQTADGSQGSPPAGEPEVTQGLVDKASEMAASVSETVSQWFGTGDSPSDDPAVSRIPDPLAFSAATYTALGPDKGRVTLSGRAPIGSKVQFRIDAEPAGEAIAAENGRFLHRWDKWLPVGEHRAEADVVEADGSVKLKSALTFLRQPQAGDLPPPPLTTTPAEVASVEGSPAPEAPAASAEQTLVEAPSGKLTIGAIRYEPMSQRSGRVTVEGRAASGSEVRVLTDGDDIGITQAGADGRYRFEREHLLRPGRHKVSVESSNAAGDVTETVSLAFDRNPSEKDTLAAAATTDPQPPQPATTSAAATAEQAPANAPAATEESAGDETASPPPVSKPRIKRRHAHADQVHRSHRVTVRKAGKRHAARSGKRKMQLAHGQRRRQRLALAPRHRTKQVNVVRGSSVERVLLQQSFSGGMSLPGRHRSSRWYRVRRGDTLWSIARVSLGRGARYREIVALNPRSLRDANLIRRGQRLRLPST